MRQFFCCYICICCLKLHQADYQVENFLFYFCASAFRRRRHYVFGLSVQLELTKLTCPERRPSGLGISMHAEGSKNISPFSRFITDSITLDMLLENDGNFGEVINGTDIRPDSTHLS